GIDKLKVTYTGTVEPVDLRVEYLFIPLLKLTHYTLEDEKDESLILIGDGSGYHPLGFEYSTDYNITGQNNNQLIFYTFYSSITPDCLINDTFFINYEGYLTEEINPVINMVLEILGYDGIWRPIAKVPLLESGEFDFTFFMNEVDLPIPLNEERIMRLVYLPTNLTNYSDEYLEVDYSGFNCVYNTSYSVEQMFTLTVNGMESKIQLIPTEFSQAVDRWAIIPERQYVTTTNPQEAMHEGEPFTYLDLHRTVTDTYNFQYQLLDEEGKALENQLVWMEIGWKPKSGLNYKIIDWKDEDGEYIDSEALGTAWFMKDGIPTCHGPGVRDDEYSVSRMFTRPEVWNYLDPMSGETEQYCSYYWNYQITDHNGLVNFNVTFDDKYISEHARIFDESMFSSGSISFDSMDDYRLYVRVVHAPVYDVGKMAIVDSSELLSSNDNDVFDMECVSELNTYDATKTTFYQGSYAEGLITLHQEDIMLGVPNLLVYQYGSDLNNFSFEVEVAEANPMPDTEFLTINKLENSFETKYL
ncbi:MAG: hypothetical protein HWN66_22000, partial [Candidatus Helarchaeota archaeon]|nr:hypothetical protein [Candidatus Helarchaeota archaeon]